MIHLTCWSAKKRSLTFSEEKRTERCESLSKTEMRRLTARTDGEVEDGELRSILPTLSQEDEWKACLSASFYILFLSSPAASLWLLPWLQCACVCLCVCASVCVRACGERPLSEQQEYIITQTKGAGLLFMNYQPSKANKGPYFHRKLHFHFSSI